MDTKKPLISIAGLHHYIEAAAGKPIPGLKRVPPCAFADLGEITEDDVRKAFAETLQKAPVDGDLPDLTGMRMHDAHAVAECCVSLAPQIAATVDDLPGTPEGKLDTAVFYLLLGLIVHLDEHCPRPLPSFFALWVSDNTEALFDFSPDTTQAQLDGTREALAKRDNDTPDGMCVVKYFPTTLHQLHGFFPGTNGVPASAHARDVSHVLGRLLAKQSDQDGRFTRTDDEFDELYSAAEAEIGVRDDRRGRIEQGFRGLLSSCGLPKTATVTFRHSGEPPDLSSLKGVTVVVGESVHGCTEIKLLPGSTMEECLDHALRGLAEHIGALS